MMNFCTLTGMRSCVHKQACVHCTSTKYEVIRLLLSELFMVMLRANGHDSDLIVNIELMEKTVEVTN